MTDSEHRRPPATQSPTRREDCAFCGSVELKRTHQGLMHPRKADHGPFEFYKCASCGSGVMRDLPTAGALAALYGSFQNGLPELHRRIMQDDPQHELYALCAKRMLQRAVKREGTVWADVGAGGGELSAIMSRAAPDARGIAIDLHTRPKTLADTRAITWIQADLNEEGFVDKNNLGAAADMVISTAVWEHVLQPDQFAGELIRLLKPGGVLYLMCPDYGSIARKVMATGWPYFTPGEHLNMPTVTGARICLERQWSRVRPGAAMPHISSCALSLPYSFRYVLRRFGWDRLGRLLPPRLGAPLPAGALEAVLVAPIG